MEKQAYTLSSPDIVVHDKEKKVFESKPRKADQAADLKKASAHRRTAPPVHTIPSPEELKRQIKLLETNLDLIAAQPSRYSDADIQKLEHNLEQKKALLRQLEKPDDRH